MAAVVVAIRNKQYDAEDAQRVLLDKDLINPFPPEAEWRADLIIEKLMMDGYIRQFEFCDRDASIF